MATDAGEPEGRALDGLDALLAHAPDAALVFDRASGRIEWLNEGAARLFGCTPKQLVATEVTSLVREWRAGVPDGESRFLDLVATLPGGGETAVHASLTMGVPDARCALVLLRPAAPHTAAEAALRRYHDEIEGLLNRAPCGYHSTDAEGRFVAVNDTELQWLGYARDEVVGRLRVVDVGTAASARLFAPNRARLAEEGFIGGVEYEFVRKDGTTFLGLVTATARYDEEGNFVGSRSIVLDITPVKRAEAALLRESEIVKAIRTVAVAANEASVVEDAARVAVEEVARFLGWPLGRAFLPGRGRAAGEAPASVWFVEGEDRYEAFRRASEETRFDGGRGIAGRVLLTGEAAWVADINREPGALRAREAGEAGLRACLIFPIRAARETVGLLEFFSTEAVPPDAELLAAITQIGTQLGRVVERAHSEASVRRAHEELAETVGELERRTREVTLINEMGDLLQACTSIDEARDVIAPVARRLFPTEAGVLYLFAPSRNVLEGIVEWGDHPPGEQVILPEDCWALRRGRAHLVTDESGAPSCKHVEDPSSSYLCVPMAAQGDTLGLMHIRAVPQPTWVRAPDLARMQPLVVAVSEHLALALANFRLRETLHNLSIRDPLTGLYNRRYLEESLDRELRRADRHGRVLSVLAVDIDHFKRVNDTFGHHVGDTLLQSLARTLEASVRAEDIVCRYGGEEFVVVLPDTSLEDAIEKAERLRRAASATTVVRRGGGDALTATISIGVGAYPQHGTTRQELFAVCDAALYRAKAEGRDRVVAAS